MTIPEYLAYIGKEREHELRQILQAQLGRHQLEWLCPEPEAKKPVILEKIRNPNGKVA